MPIHRRRQRLPAHIQLVTNTQSATGETLDFSRAEPRNNDTPLADGGGTDAQRPRDVRSVLKVIDNVLFKHRPMLTVFKSRLQPHLIMDALTSVDMDKFATLAERLKDAMGAEISASALARACDVSPAAVSHWLDGTTKKLSADNYASAARALGVREEWLRTGRLPRDREHANEERQVERIIDLLEGLQVPLAALAGAIQQLNQLRPSSKKKHKGAA
jgi:transcriptional regulator with XRE-family HTH domain